MMRERPILMSAPMVRALLDGRKTQTRRIVKDAPRDAYEVVPSLLAHSGDLFDFRRNLDNPVAVRCPYGVPGQDRLWVKETHQIIEMPNSTICAYRATCEDDSFTFVDPHASTVELVQVKKWRPAIFMRRLESRLTLDITSVRVERLHDITEEDARAEGVEAYINGHGPITEREIAADPGIRHPAMYRHGFEYLWSAINGEDSWRRNDWVWVVEFKRVEAEARAA